MCSIASGPNLLLCHPGRCLHIMIQNYSLFRSAFYPPGREESQFKKLPSHPTEEEMATHSSTLAWKIPWTEEPCRLQSMGSQRVGHDWVTSLHFPSKTLNTALLCPLAVFYIITKSISWLGWRQGVERATGAPGVSVEQEQYTNRSILRT